MTDVPAFLANVGAAGKGCGAGPVRGFSYLNVTAEVHLAVIPVARTCMGAVAARSVVGLAESRRQHVADTVEKLITNSIHTAFIKYPEGDGDANMDYDWISPEQSSRITKAILLDLAANGFEIVKKGAA
jgi:hypothetical protein